MPTIRPFRALRYDPEAVGDLSRVVSPPYDVIGPAELTTLLARHPRNIVRLDLPTEQLGDEPDERYRRVARTFAAWRSDGTFHRDRRPSLYVYEQAYRVPGTDIERVQRGFFGRLRLEPFGPGSGVMPHERTLAGPREDRYRLIRATGANFSPVVGLYRDGSGRSGRLLDGVGSRPADVEVSDDEEAVHRLWALPEVEPGADDPDAGLVARLTEAAGAGPITIADGHHRYETALRYRDERRSPVSGDEDEPFDFILMLFLEESQPLTVLPTHRVVRGLGDDGVDALLSGAGLAELFDVRPASRAEVEAAFGVAALAPGGRGRMALWTRTGGAFLEARRSAFEGILPAGGMALRRLDVVLLQAAVERLAGIDAAAVAEGRFDYTKSAAEAMAWVDAGAGASGAGASGADAAFLLEPTPIADITAVAAAGDVMPQKSTYFYPKPLSGIVVNPHEW